jgi:hypothetical protein
MRTVIWFSQLDSAIEDYVNAAAALARATNEVDRHVAQTSVRDRREWLDFVMEQIRRELDKAREAMRTSA